MTKKRAQATTAGEALASAVRTLAVTIMALVVPGLLAASGCGEKDSSRKHRPLEGTIEKINQLDSEVTLRYFSEKHKTEATVTGTVTAETEIFINGKLSSLEDLREGERVTVVGWVKRRGEEREVIAAKITVERADTIRREPPAQPTDAGSGPARPGNATAPAGAAQPTGTPPPPADDPG